MAQAFIVDYLRSPFALARKGDLAGVRPDDLAAGVVAALVERAGVDPELVEDVILGCAFPEGEQGFNIARCVVATRRAAAERRRLHGEPLVRLVDAGGPDWPPAPSPWEPARPSSRAASRRCAGADDGVQPHAQPALGRRPGRPTSTWA